MASPLELKRLWRDVRSPADARGVDRARFWLEEGDAAAMARAGWYHLESLAQHKCLIFLGRPGAGKTSEIERIVSGHVKGFVDEYCVTVSCKEIEARIDDELARVPEWRGAAQQSKPVRLVIDALDEGYLRDPRHFTALKLGLKNLRSQFASLRLLLVCRPAEWDETFGKAVHNFWGEEDEPQAYILEPLSTDSQSTLVQSWGIDEPKLLLRWVRVNTFEEFAAWPRSLRWLTEQFRTGELNESPTRSCADAARCAASRKKTPVLKKLAVETERKRGRTR